MNRLISLSFRPVTAPLLAILSISGSLAAQDDYRAEDDAVRPAPCWTTVLEFYDPRAFPYYSVNDYFFDANPFHATRWMDGNTSMIMRSGKGSPLVDVTGNYEWTDARIRVDCYERNYILYSRRFAVVRYEFGEGQADYQVVRH